MKINKINVMYENQIIGVLTLTKDKKVAFQYTDAWIKNGFSINPFSLPLDKKVRVANKPFFEGLFGVFADSLPDSWGNLLLERMIKKYNIKYEDFTVLDKLSLIGKNSMGLLTYEPVNKVD